MVRRSGARGLLLAVFVTSAACAIWRTKDIGSEARLPEGAKVASLVLWSGERVVFSTADPGRVHGGDIEGTAVNRLSVPIEIEGPFASIRKRADGTVYEITDGKGRTYAVERVIKEGDSVWSIFVNDRTVRRVSIRVADVSQIRYKRNYPGLTFLAVAGPAVGLLYMIIVSKLHH